MAELETLKEEQSKTEESRKTAEEQMESMKKDHEGKVKMHYLVKMFQHG